MVEPSKGGPALPISAINILAPGEKLKYEPLYLPDAIKSKAKVAVLVAPAPEAKSQRIIVLEACPAKASAEWVVPLRASVVGVVFGPRGLSVKKVNSLINKNDELVPELADYAQKTETVQALIQTLSQYEESPSPGQDLNAALQGFSAHYDVMVPRLDPSAPASEQASTLLRAVLPSLSTYNPLASERATAVQQTSGLAASVAALFFGAPVGLAAGGTALVSDLHSIMSPNTDFRAAFTQSGPANGLALCSTPEPDKSHRRTAYLWMLRIPDALPPAVYISGPAGLPLGTAATLEVSSTAHRQLGLLARARDWRLVSASHGVSIPVKVTVGEKRDTLSLDLSKAKLHPGEYLLAAKWDWTPMEVAGTVRLHRPGDFSKVKLAPGSADKLVTGSGTVAIQVTGTDFEFVHSLTILPAGNPQAGPKAVPFTLSKANRTGEQLALDAQVDTSSLPAGAYLLRFSQTGDGTHDMPITVHPLNPTLSGLPMRVNLGEAQQTLELRGTSLERVTGITGDDAQWQLSPVDPGSRGLTERQAMVKLLPKARQGDHLAFRLAVKDIEKPLTIADVLVVAGPRPRITDANASFPQESDVELKADEIPSGSPVSFAIYTEHVDAQPSLALQCADPDETRRAMELHPGDKRNGADLDLAGEGILFLSLDPGSVGQAGCTLMATVSTADAGNSTPYTLGHIVRLPRIRAFSLTNQRAGPALYRGMLTGEDLQTIAKTGWNPQTGYPVQGIPTPILEQAGMQTLKIELPWPSPEPRAPLFIWLRGETSGRKTAARY